MEIGGEWATEWIRTSSAIFCFYFFVINNLYGSWVHILFRCCISVHFTVVCLWLLLWLRHLFFVWFCDYYWYLFAFNWMATVCIEAEAVCLFCSIPIGDDLLNLRTYAEFYSRGHRIIFMVTSKAHHTSTVPINSKKSACTHTSSERQALWGISNGDTAAMQFRFGGSIHNKRRSRSDQYQHKALSVAVNIVCVLQ